MNIFFHGTIAAGFNAIKGKLEKDMAGPMGKLISEELKVLIKNFFKK